MHAQLNHGRYQCQQKFFGKALSLLNPAAETSGAERSGMTGQDLIVRQSLLLLLTKHCSFSIKALPLQGLFDIELTAALEHNRCP